MRGPCHAFAFGQHGRVLRVCKRKLGPGSEPKKKHEAGIPAPSHNDKILTKAEQALWSHSPQMVEAKERVELQHAFLTEVMAPLLGTDVVCPGVSYTGRQAVPARQCRQFLIPVLHGLEMKRD